MILTEFGDAVIYLATNYQQSIYSASTFFLNYFPL